MVKTISFESKDLDPIGNEILAPGGPRAIRVRESRAGGRSVVFVARHADVRSVLTDESTYSLAHYPALFQAIAPPRIQLVMAPQTDDLKRQRDLLKRAVGAVDNTALANGMPLLGSEKNRRAIAKRAVANVLDCFRAREKAEFDIIGEYAYFVPYLVAREMFGLPGPPRRDLLSRFYATLRWLGGSVHRFTPETIPFLTAVYWAQLAFAQVFRNFENRELHFRLLGTSASARLVGHIRGRLDLELQGYDPYPGSLLDRLCKAIEGALPEDRDRDRDYAASLLVEMFGTTLLIPPLAFAGIVDWMVKQKGGIPARLEGLDETNARAYVDELLRLAPPSKYLLRTATKGVQFDDVHVDQNGYVCALVAQACRDPEAFKDPNTFSSARKQNVLHFGPVGGPHECLGRELARDMFTEMLLGLQKLDGLWPVGGAEMKDILGISELMVGWNREEEPMVRGYGPYRSTGGHDG